MEMRGIACFGLLVALLACPARADIINGSFETGDFTGWLKQDGFGGAAVTTGGTDGQYEATLVCEGYYSERIPGQFVPDLVAIWQTFVVDMSAQWLLFDAWVEGSVSMEAIIPGTGLPAVTVDRSTPATYVIAVAPMQGESIVLDFRARDWDVGQNVAHVDNVRLVEIPEAGTLALCGMGALWLVVVRRVR